MGNKGRRQLHGRGNHAASGEYDRGSVIRRSRVAITDTVQHRRERDDDVSYAIVPSLHPAICVFLARRDRDPDGWSFIPSKRRDKGLHHSSKDVSSDQCTI